MATELSMEERFAPRLPGPIRRQVEKTEEEWAKEAADQGKTPEELKAEEEDRLRKEAEDKEKADEQERLRLEEEERQRAASETVPKKDFDELRHQFDVLKGKYDAEKGPDLRVQVNTLMEQNNLLREQIKMLQEKKPEVKKVSFRENPKILALKNDFSEEGFENLVSALEETVGEIKTAHEQEIATLKGEVGKTIGASKQELFWNAVFEKHSDYDRLRVDPKFSEFLGEEEGMSGYTKYDFFMDAFKTMKASVIIKYLDAYKKSLNPPKIDSQPNKEKLEKRLGAPKPSGAAGRDTGTGKITAEDVANAKTELEKMASDFNRGVWKGREKEYEKREAELWKIIDSGPSE